MDIVMVTDTYHPGFDGIVRYLDYLITELLLKGHTITVVCPFFKGEKHYSSPQPGLTVIRTLTSRIRINAYFFALPDIRLLQAIRQANVVIIHSLMPLGVFGSFLAKLFKKKIGFWCHHDERVILKDILKAPSLVSRIAFALMRWYYRSMVDVFFCATERFRQKLLLFSAPTEKIVYLPFAIDLTKFRPEPEFAIRQKYSIPSEAIVASYLGRLSVEKNVTRILSALDEVMSEIPNLYALIVGGGPDKTKLLSLERKNKERFIFTGFIPEEELQSHYASSDLFVSPTLNESSCFTVFEAMSCSVPVITSAFEHDPEITHMEQALLVQNVLDVNEITEKIFLLATNLKFRKFLAFNARRLITARTWQNHSEKFLSALDEHCFFVTQHNECSQKNITHPLIAKKRFSLLHYLNGA